MASVKRFDGYFTDGHGLNDVLYAEDDGSFTAFVALGIPLI